MKKDITHTLLTFSLIGVILFSSSFVYQKQVYAKEQEAIRVERQNKEQERIAFLARLDSESAKVKAAEEAERVKVAEEKRLNEARIAAIADEVERQAALKAAAEAEAKRQADLLIAKQQAEAIAQKALEERIAAVRLAAEKAAADRRAAKKVVRRSRAS